MIRIFRFFVPASILALLVFETVATLSTFLLCIYLFIELDPADYLLNNLGLVSAGLVSLSFLAGLYMQDLYSQVRVKSRLLLAQQLMMVVGIVFLLQALIGVMEPDLSLPFRIVLLGCLMLMPVIFLARLLFNSYVVPRVASERLLLIGERPIMADIKAYVKDHPQLGIDVVGHYRERDLEVNGPKSSGAGEQPHLNGLVRQTGANSIIVDVPEARLASELLELRYMGYSVAEAAATYAKISNREGLSALSTARLLFTKEFEPRERDLFFEKSVDMVIAAISLLLFLPVIVAIAAAVRLSFPGAVFDASMRMGRNQSSFVLYNFRLMKGADSDPSETFMGRFLSRTGLYALPQLWNVLRGELSIVGPRPHRPEFHAELTRQIPFYPHRLKVSPGMTGLSQIEKRRLPPLPDAIVELEYDLYYLKNASPVMALFILVQSIKNVIVWGGEP
jgi:lipopolysaccharide/colanic/teichoic acid biosynthesis glycosyltransferase